MPSLAHHGPQAIGEARRPPSKCWHRPSRRCERRSGSTGEIGWLTVGVMGSAIAGIFAELLMASQMRLPEVELTLQELRTAQQVQALRERRIDVGVLRHLIRAEAFAVETFGRDPFVDVLPHTQPTQQSGISRHIICRHA
jgi:DNA-binding transcriptional LysR family regulator